jgi:hypothetical protein
VDPEWAPCGSCACPVSGDAGYVKWQLPGLIPWESRICPRKLVTPETRAWLQIYSTYKAGFLLVAGGILDQPAIYINAMTTIDSLVAEARKK